MKFDKLDIENFLTIRRATVFLNDRGLNVIQGVNDDDGSASSNGAGKSSVVDSLCWCLYGTTARGVKGDDVVNLAAKKDCRVTVWMVHGETEYIVSRSRKHKEHKNALQLMCRPAGDPGRIPDDLSKGTDAETQKEVERVLGCSQEVFLAAVYSGQELMPDLPKMKDRELKRLIEESAGLERIELAYEEARARRSTLRSKLDAVDLKRESCKTRIARDEAVLEIKIKEAERFEVERNTRIEQARATEAERGAERLKVLVAVRDGKPAADAARAKLTELEKQLAGHRALETAARNAEMAAQRADAAIDRALLANCRATVATIAAQIENVDGEMAEPCPECGKPHTEADKSEYLAYRAKRLEDAKENLKLAEKKVREQAIEAQRMRDLATAARAEVPDITEVGAEAKAANVVISEFDKLVSSAKIATGHHEAAKSALAMRESEPNPVAAVVESLRGSINSEAATLADLTTKHAELIKEVEIAEDVVKVFGPAGVRAHILDTVTPFLNERTADYLSALSDSAITAVWTTLTKTAAGDLREKFSIDVSSVKGGDSFLALSGGEKRKVRIATALALQDLVASRASQPIDLWIADEVDDALDPAGLERLMVILERRARERGTVLVISHNDLADWCDRITTVRKKAKWESAVEGSLCS